MASEFYKLKGGYDEDGKWYIGRARLFFITEFRYNKKCTLQYKISIDFKQLKSCLEFFKIKVNEPMINSTKNEMIECFKDKTDYFGCAIIFIFTHGDQDHFYCSDYDEENGDGKINVWDEFYHYFSGEFKPQLKECPKVFFNEWCQVRGNITTEDVINKISLSHDTADWLIYNAALRTYPNNENSTIGSFSTQAFCKLLKEHGETNDLEHILTLVKRLGYQAEVGPFEHLQPFTSSSLLKKLYLLPESKIYQLKSTYRNEFQHVGVLGEGKFGVVFKARNVIEDTMYAVKRIQLLENTEAEQSRIKREIEFLAQLNCPQIVRYYRSWEERAEYNCQKKEDEGRDIKRLRKPESNIIHFYFIQMELCRETLEVYLKNTSLRDKVKSLNIFEQIVEGLAFLHKRDKVHRDLKPANILFALTNNENDLFVRIADFGLAREVGKSSTIQVSGTLLYMAPEMKLKRFDAKVDIFSAGLILLELLYNCSGENHDDVLFEAQYKNFPQAFQKELSFAFPLLEKLLSPKSSERPTSEELLDILHKEFKYEEVYFESICTLEDHIVHQVNGWKTVDTLLWNADEGFSVDFPLSEADHTKTRWNVRFHRYTNNDFAIGVRCVLLEAQFRAASVRVLAVIEGHPNVWMEVTAVLQYGCESEWWGCFPRKITEMLEFGSLIVHVHATWTELDTLPLTFDLWNSKPLNIRCRWRLHYWKTVSPTSEKFWLFSETFGQRGALWRIIVDNQRSGNNRILVVWLQLQHLPASNDPSILAVAWNCSLSLWNQQFKEQCNICGSSVQRSECGWTVVQDVASEIKNPLDLTVVITMRKLQ